jgi:hypothetical protein
MLLPSPIVEPMRTKPRQGEKPFLRLRFSNPATRGRTGYAAVHQRYINGATAAPWRSASGPLMVISAINQQLSRKDCAFFPRSGTGRAKTTRPQVRFQIYLTEMTWLFSSPLRGESQGGDDLAGAVHEPPQRACAPLNQGRGRLEAWIYEGYSRDSPLGGRDENRVIRAGRRRAG